MEEEIAVQRTHSLALCQRILRDLSEFQSDVDQFFGGEMRAAYQAALEQVMHNVHDLQKQIRNL